MDKVLTPEGAAPPPPPTIKLILELGPGGLTVTGPINDPILCFGMLMSGIMAIQKTAERKEVPVHIVPPIHP
jgi:hypothetical protein